MIKSSVVGALLISTAVQAQEATFPTFTVSGRLQTQFYLFGNDNQSRTGSESNFFIRRARIQVNAKLRENVSLVIQPSFEGGRASGVRLHDGCPRHQVDPSRPGPPPRPRRPLRVGAGHFDLMPKLLAILNRN